MLIRRGLVLGLILLAGCATPSIDKTFSLEAQRGTGVATGTLTYEGGYAAYRLHVVGLESGQSYRIQHGESQTLNLVLAFKGEPVHPELGVQGSPFAVELPAGSYVIKQWQISQGAANVWSTQPVGITFRVEPGQSIYLGNFHFRETSRFGRAVTGAAVTLTDMSQRDLPVLQKNFPALKSNPIAQSLEPRTRIDNVGGRSDGKLYVPLFVPVTR